MSKPENSLMREILEAPIPVEHLDKVKKTDLRALEVLQSSRDEAAMKAMFPIGFVYTITQMRNAFIDEVGKRKVTKPVQEGLMTAAWNGKIQISIEPTKTSEQIVVRTQSGDRIATGSGPITTQQTFKPFMQRAIHVISCYTKEDKDHGVISTVDLKIPSMFPDFSLLKMGSIASFLNEKVPKPYETLTGSRWQQKLISIVGSMTHQEQIILNNTVVIEVLQGAELNKPESKKFEVPVWNPKTAKPYLIESKAKLDDVKELIEKPQLSWSRNVDPVRMNLSTAANPNKMKGSFGPEIGWAQAAVSALGATNVLALAMSLGLAPGLSETEAEIIRFVTVAMAEYHKSAGSIKVHGTQMQLLYLYYSLKEYIKHRDPKDVMKETDIDKEIQQHVHFSHIGLSTQSIMMFRDLFNAKPDPDDMKHSSFIAWNPSRFTSAARAEDVVKASNAKSQILVDMAVGYGRTLIFREILEVSQSIKYTDGFPALFNYWDTDIGDACAMERHGNTYKVVKLPVAPEQHLELSFKAVRQLLAYPFAPSTKRSYRIMAVMGNKLMSVLDYEAVADVMGLGDKVDETPEQTLLALVVESKVSRHHLAEPGGVVQVVAPTVMTTATTTTTTTVTVPVANTIEQQYESFQSAETVDF